MVVIPVEPVSVTVASSVPVRIGDLGVRHGDVVLDDTRRVRCEFVLYRLVYISGCDCGMEKSDFIVADSIAALIAVPSYAIRQTWIRQNARTMSMGEDDGGLEDFRASFQNGPLPRGRTSLPPLHPLTPRRWIRSSSPPEPSGGIDRIAEDGLWLDGHGYGRGAFPGGDIRLPCPYRTIRLNRESGACTLPSRHRDICLDLHVFSEKEEAAFTAASLADEASPLGFYGELSGGAWAALSTAVVMPKSGRIPWRPWQKSGGTGHRAQIR